MKRSDPPRISADDDFTDEALSQRNIFASNSTGANLDPLLQANEVGTYRGNVENIFGFIKIPLGLAGPLKLDGQHAQGDFLIPLATTEGSLVASYNRGMKAITQSGGATVSLTKNEIHASVTFMTDSPKSASALRNWIVTNDLKIKQAAESTTRHGEHLRTDCFIFGSRLLTNFVYDPADAMGINMISSASLTASALISKENGGVQFWLPSALQGDKKATFFNFLRGRGRSVGAHAVIPNKILKDTLKSDAKSILRYHQNNIETAHLTGGFGFNMHIANGITALGLATGQDIAYLGESANGHLIVEEQQDGLLFSLTIPSLYVGTVGGGTALPTHKPCLEMLECSGPGSVLKLAEIFAGTCLAGEISVLAAIASQDFVSAHNLLGRNRPKLEVNPEAPDG